MVGTFPPGTYIYYVYIYIGNGNVRAPPLKCGAIEVRPHTQAGAHPAQIRVQG
nr:MAG TPA: hypothetical protein [Caudoviricetes sp.]